MEKTTLLTTVKELEDFLSSNYRKTGVRPSLGEALDMMEKKHLLSSPHVPTPTESKVQHTLEQICEIIDSQAVDVTAFLQNTSDSGASHLSVEDAIFAPGRDVAAMRLFSYLSAEPTEYESFSVIVALKNECEIFFDGVPLAVAPGGVVILPPHTPHTMEVPEDSYVIALHMRRSTFDAQFGALMTSGDKMSVFFRESLYGAGETAELNYLHMAGDFESGSTLSLLHELVRECTSKAPLANLCSMSWMELFLATVFRAHGENASILRSGRDETTRADCGAILQYIQQNYRTVRLSSLARTFHYNETYLSRMLQNYMGMSFTDIVRGIKMTRAEEYLSSSSLRIHEISALVGYDSVDHFSRTFKATHNISPQAYRRTTAKRGLRSIAELPGKTKGSEKK